MYRSKNGILFVSLGICTAAMLSLTSPNLAGQEAIPGEIAKAIFGTVDKLIDQDLETVRECQLNPPLNDSAKKSASQDDNQESNIGLFNKNGIVETRNLIMLPTPEIMFACECLNCPVCSSTCNGGDAKECPNQIVENNTSSFSSAKSHRNFCNDVANELLANLIGSEKSVETQKREITAALKLVSDHANVNAETRMEETQRHHNQTVDLLQQELKLAAKRPAIKPESTSTLEALYAAQYRNAQQIRTLTRTNQVMLATMNRLEVHLAKSLLSQRAKLSDSEMRRMMSAVEENERYESEVNQLKTELQSLDGRIKQLQQPATVRPASYLEPVYDRQSPLTPIHQTIKR